MKTQRWYDAVRSNEANQKKRDWALATAHGIKHGHYCGSKRSPEYNSWRSMIGRCLTPSDTAYAHYGAKGILVCARWRKFENFLEDMGERPDGMSLDRYPNPAGNYEPGNCRWATRHEQRINRREHA